MSFLRQLARKVRGEKAFGEITPKEILAEYAKADKSYETQNKVKKGGK